MRYIINYSTKNGIGKPAISLFFKGCDKAQKCNGCHNEEFQTYSSDEIDLPRLKQQLIKQIASFKMFHDELHIAFLGGEPLAVFNIEYTIEIAKWIKEVYPEAKSTVYSYHEIDPDSQISQYFDYGVLGEFDIELLRKDYLPGSSNQYIYDFKNKTKIEPIYIGEEKEYAI
jgi:organic radical activating enzyme